MGFQTSTDKRHLHQDQLVEDLASSCGDDGASRYRTAKNKAVCEITHDLPYANTVVRSSREAKKKKKLSQDSPNKYRKSAESFVEGCREAIKLLNEQEEYHMLESSKNKLYTDTKLTDPSKETMTWMFHLIFYATLKPDQARKQTGYAQTVRTTDGSVCPSDTEDNKNKKMTIEDKSTISHDMQRHLFVAPDIKGKVLDHLLGSWTELAEEEIVLSRDSDTRTEKEEAELQKSVDSVIKQSISNSQHNEVLSQEGERKAFWDSFQAKGKRRKRKTGGTSISPLPNSGSSKTTPGDVSKFNWKDGGEMDTQAGQAPVQNDKSPVQSLKETEKSKSKVEEAPRSHLTDKKSKPEPKNEATEPKVKDDGELGHDQIWEKYGEIAKREESARRKFLTDKQAKRDAAVKDIVLDHSKGEGEERTAVEDDIWAWSTKPWSNSTPGTTAVQLDDFQTEPQSNNKETTSKPEVEKDNKSSSEQPTFESGPEGWCDGWDETWTVQTTEKRDGPTVAIVTDYNSDDGALPDTSASVATKKSAITSRTTNSVRFQPGDGGSTSEKFLKEKHGNLPKASSISRSDHNSLFSNRTSTEYGSEFQGARDDESRHGMPKIWEHDVKDRRPEDGIAMKQPSNPTDWRAQPITLFDTRPSKVPPINSNNPFGPGLRPNRNGSDPRRSRFTASADHIEKNLPEQSGPFKLPHRPSQTPIVRQNSEDTSTYGGLDESWEGVPYPDEKASKATKIKEKTDRSTPQGRAPNLKGYGMYQPSLKNPYDYSSYGPYRYQSNNHFVSQPGYPPRWTGTSDYGSQYPKGQDNEEKLSKELSLVSSNLGKELSRVVSRMDHYQEQLDEKNFEQMLRKQLEDEMSRAAQERDHKIAELSRKVTELEEQDKIKEERRWEEKREEWEKHRIELQSVMLRAKEIEEQKLAVADITTRATEERLNNRLSDEKEEKLKLHREVETLQAASKALAEDLEKAKADATLAAEQVKAFQERLQQRAQAVPNVFQYSDARTDTESTDNSDGSSTTSEDNESTPNPSVADTSATIEGNIPRSRGSSTIAADPGFHSILFPSQPRWGAIPKEQFESLLHGSGFRSFFQEHLPAISQQVGPYEQQRAGTGGNILSGTMFWEPPGPTAEAELHKALRNGGWRPTYVRATSKIHRFSTKEHS